MHPKVLRLRAAATVLTVAAGLPACSGSGAEELDIEGFAPGACTEIAPTLEDVDETLREVQDEAIEPREAADRFKAAQATLKEQGARAPEQVKQSVTELVTSLGFFRIAVDSNNYDGSQVDDARSQLEALAEACRS